MRIGAKYKFMSAVAFMFLLPFLILSMHFARGYRELEKMDALGRMGLRTRGAANEAAGLLTYGYDVSDLARSRSFLSASAEERKKILEGRIKTAPGIFSELAVLSPSGKEIARTGASSGQGNRDHSGTELFRKVSAGRVPAGTVEYGKYTPPVLVMLTPLFKAGGERAEGYLLARMSLARLGEAVRSMGRSSYGDLGVLDAGGRVIGDSMGYSIMSPGIKAPGEVLRAVGTASARGLEDLRTGGGSNGRPLLVSVSRISGTGWWVFETADAEARVNRAYSFWVRRVILIGVALIIFFSFASYRLAVRWLAGGTHV